MEFRHEENGIEFWYARELMELLEYAQWRNFEKTIEKAKIEQLQGEYPEIVKHIKELPALVLECDFNTILTSDIEALKAFGMIA